MIKKRDNKARMFHLSYDKKHEEDDSDILKKDIIWSILDLDINSIIKAPVASTITIESHQDYEKWESMFNIKYKQRMYYVISETRQKEESYFMDIELNEEMNNAFTDKVISIQQEILRFRKHAGNN
ncbi:MAG: hypothetical protein P1U44_13020 [Vicingaceae bacterium]|nr:hypothetical protein [Vicingaceae bacterium]